MHRSSFLALALTVLLVGLVGLTVAPLAERAGSPPEWPGSKGRGVTLLPNGWKIAPAGRSFHVGDFPLSMVQSPDGRYVIVSNNGWSRPTLTTVDVVQGFVKSRLPVDHAWLGLAWSPDGKQLYSSGAANNTVNTFAYANGDLKASGSIVLERPSIQFPAGTRELGGTGFIGGVAINADGPACTRFTCSAGASAASI
jgi:WD40 repeat protein